MLNWIVHFKDNDNVTHENCFNDQKQVDSSKSSDIPDMQLSLFTVFVESLGLPVNKIEPKLVGNRMRVGAFATEDLDVDNVYIALHTNSVIDVNTALADADINHFGLLLNHNPLVRHLRNLTTLITRAYAITSIGKENSLFVLF